MRIPKLADPSAVVNPTSTTATYTIADTRLTQAGERHCHRLNDLGRSPALPAEVNMPSVNRNGARDGGAEQLLRQVSGIEGGRVQIFGRILFVVVNTVLKILMRDFIVGDIGGQILS